MRLVEQTVSEPLHLRIGPELLRGLDDERELALHVFRVDLVALRVRSEAALRADANSDSGASIHGGRLDGGHLLAEGFLDSAGLRAASDDLGSIVNLLLQYLLIFKLGKANVSTEAYIHSGIWEAYCSQL